MPVFRLSYNETVPSLSTANLNEQQTAAHSIGDTQAIRWDRSMAIAEDIAQNVSDWICFDEMLYAVAAANQVDVPHLKYWLHMKRFCDVRPFRLWHPHIEYQQSFPQSSDRHFVKGAVFVEFLLGSNGFPDEMMLWALQNGGVVFWQKSIVSGWLCANDADVPESWVASSNPINRADLISACNGHWVTKAEILQHKWPLPVGDRVPPLEKVLDDLPLWVSEACKKVGRPGYGAKNSHLWNPAMLAICMLTTTSYKRWSAPKAALDRLIRSSYPDSIPEWERRCELL